MRRLFLLAPVLLALLLPASAPASIAKLGSGSSVTCDTTPAAGSDLDDTSVSNAYIRDIVCTNAGSTTVYVGGSGVTTNGTPIPPGSSYKAQLGASVVPQCYAATSTTVSCVEAMGSSEFDVPAAIGSRVELLYSGTHTELSGAPAGFYAPIKTAFAPPTWCKTVVFVARIDAIVLGPGATLTWAAYNADAADEPLTTSAGGLRGLEASTVAAPTENNGVVMVVGPDSPSINAALAGTSRYSYPTFIFPMIGFSYNWATAPTSWSVRWYAYCVGG